MGFVEAVLGRSRMRQIFVLLLDGLIAGSSLWFAMLLRPENMSYDAGGFPSLHAGAFSPPVLIQPFSVGENALAICESSPDNTPYACDEGGAAGGPYRTILVTAEARR